MKAGLPSMPQGFPASVKGMEGCGDPAATGRRRSEKEDASRVSANGATARKGVGEIAVYH